jgi:hypothetical protein
MAFSQAQRKISGTVMYESGTPALGIPVNLLKDGKVQARTYTNQAGKFSFDAFREPPNLYNIQIGPTRDSPAQIIPVNDKSPRGQTVTIR